MKSSKEQAVWSGNGYKRPKIVTRKFREFIVYSGENIACVLLGSRHGPLTQTLTQTRKKRGGGDGTYGAERICNLTKDGQTDMKPSDVISRTSWGSRGRGFKSRHSDQKALKSCDFKAFS